LRTKATVILNPLTVGCPRQTSGLMTIRSSPVVFIFVSQRLAYGCLRRISFILGDHRLVHLLNTSLRLIFRIVIPISL